MRCAMGPSRLLPALVVLSAIIASAHGITCASGDTMPINDTDLAAIDNDYVHRLERYPHPL